MNNAEKQNAAKVGVGSTGGSAESLLAQYMTTLQRLTAQREGVDRAIRHTESKIEAAREIIGLPTKRKPGRPQPDTGNPVSPNHTISHTGK